MLISIAEFAERLKVKVVTVRRWWAQGLIPPPCRIGHTIRWRLETIQEWEQAGCKPVGQPKREEAIS